MTLRHRLFYLRGALGCLVTAAKWAVRRKRTWRDQTLADSWYCLKVAILGGRAI